MLKIAHLSDTQIRNFQRHWEYRKAYENLFLSLRENKPDLIVVAGDIAHSKTHVSAEFFQLCTQYFKSLADIAPTVVIPGNHDLNLNNLSRLDALSPIVDALNHPRLFYYKHSGFYRHSPGVSLAVFSCIDEDWPTKEEREDIEQDDVVIGLYHGMVKDAVLQNGQRVEDCPYTLEDFLEICDFLMMGDIHRMQVLGGYRAAYCGSYPQQSFGEGLDKGYLLWEIKDKDDWEVDFIKLPNVCPFYTIELDDGLNLDGGLDIQPQSRLRVISRQLTVVEEQELRGKLNELYQPRELYFKDKENAHLQEVKIAKNVKIEDLSNVGVQEKLLQKFLSQNYETYDLEKVFELNRKYDSQVKREEDIIRNVQYKYKKMWWSNLLSYGESNEFDFSKHKGVVGVFGKNAVGKSSLAVDIPLYIQFNTNSKRVVKNDHLINERKDACEGGLEIQVGKQIYRIVRNTFVKVVKGKRKGKPVYQGFTDVDFKVFDKNGEEIEDKEGEKRQDTDKEIRKIFGTAEDFMATSVAPQWRLLEFIDKRSTDRQKTLGRYFDIDVFQAKHDLANQDVKDIKAEIKLLERQGLEVQRDGLVVRLKETKSTIKSLRDEYSLLDLKVKSLNKRALRWIEKIAPVAAYGGDTEEVLKVKLKEAKSNCLDKLKSLKELKNKHDKVVQEHSALRKLVEGFDEKSSLVTIKKWEAEIDGSLGLEIAECSAKISHIEKSLKGLEKYSCITNPDCCMLEEKRRLLSEEAAVNKKKKDLTARHKKQEKLLEEKLEPLRGDLVAHRERVRLADNKGTHAQAGKDFIDSQQELLDRMVAEVKRLEEQLKSLKDNQKQIKKNEEYQAKADAIKEDRQPLMQRMQAAEQSIYARESDEKVLAGQIENVEKSIAHYEGLKSTFEAYERYLKAMGKEGIPRIIVHNNLSLINKQIKKILSSHVNFGVELESTGKEIEIFFKHGKSKRRRIELCSGMEKTIAAIALRAAMVSVTTLPRANIFVLDEVFASLDPEYIDAVRKILQYLKNLFDSVIIITHLDGFKDLVDYVVEVERDDEGFAKITE
jgi:DNA repair exonuclease SbcCD ATPase subunit/DNA repair exonuclease SbcCD nuclease subunit